MLGRPAGGSSASSPTWIPRLALPGNPARPADRVPGHTEQNPPNGAMDLIGGRRSVKFEAGPGRGDPRSHPGWVRPSAESAGIQATSPGYHVGTPGMLVGFIPMPAGACPRTSAAAHRRAGQANRRVQPRMQVRVAAKRLGFGPRALSRRWVRCSAGWWLPPRKFGDECKVALVQRGEGSTDGPEFGQDRDSRQDACLAGENLRGRQEDNAGRGLQARAQFPPSGRQKGEGTAPSSQGQVIAADDGRDQSGQRSLRAMVRPRILPCLSLVLSAATALTAGPPAETRAWRTTRASCRLPARSSGPTTSTRRPRTPSATGVTGLRCFPGATPPKGWTASIGYRARRSRCTSARASRHPWSWAIGSSS